MGNLRRNFVYTNDGVKYPCQIHHVDFKKRAAKKNQAVKAAALIWFMLFLPSFFINKKNFLDPVYLNRMSSKELTFDAEKICAPTLKYLNNLNFMGKNLLASPSVKNNEKLIPIRSAGELIEVKRDVLKVLSQYKNLHAGVFVYDYITGRTLEINSDEVFSAASIIKIPVLLDLFNLSYVLEKEGHPPIDLNKKITFTEADRTEGSGGLQYKKAGTKYSIDYLAKIMIRQSDNSATNMLIEEAGGINEINNALRHFGFTKTSLTNRLPDLEGENTTTPKDIATMLYNIDNQKFISMQSSANIKEYMSKVENTTLIKSQLPDDVTIMHKTGDIGKMLGDAGIIFTPNGRKYILVIMVKRPHNDYSARTLIQKVSKIVYQSLK